MLLTIADLPGVGWQQLSESGWRTGITSLRRPASRRAYETGAFIALRRFRQEDPRRGLFCEVLPMATSDDAEYQVRNGRSGLVRNPGVVRLDERVVKGIEVPGVENPLIWEDTYAQRDLRGYHWNIFGRIETVAFLISGSAIDEGWSWSELVPIATAQAMKIEAKVAVDGMD